MQVSEIMHRDVKTVGPKDTFADAAKVLHDNRISSVIVEGDGGPAGIVTERDVVNIVAEGKDPSSTSVAERMTRELATVQPKTDVVDAARLMADLGIRHLPVMDKGKLAGIISIRDLTFWAVDEMTGGHEMPDLERSSAALSAAAEVERFQNRPVQ